MADLNEQEFRQVLDQTKVLLSEASEKGTLNDFWVVCDCDGSANYKDYVHRSNTQGLIDLIAKLHKNLSTRKHLETISLFAGSDKEKANKEAKRRAKKMRDEKAAEENVNEGINSVAFHERQAEAAKNQARACSDRSKKTSLMSLAKYHEKRVAELKDKKDDKKEVKEGYNNPVNVNSDQQVAGASNADNYASRGINNNGYVPGPHDPTKPQDEQKCQVPNKIIGIVKDKRRDAQSLVDSTGPYAVAEKSYYMTLEQVFADLEGFLTRGTVEDLKNAQIFMTSLMGPLLNEIPAEVVRYIATFGNPATLRDYVNGMNTPRARYGVVPVK